MSDIKKRIENYEAQVEELETLQSIYIDELSSIDQGVLADINDFISGSYSKTIQPLEYIVTISCLKNNCELWVTLPSDYPAESKPEVYVRSESFDRLQQSNFNESLLNFTAKQENGQPCIHILISWVQENFENYLNSFNNKKSSKKSLDKLLVKKNDVSFSRYWIYSHHIYSKIKRREIIELAKDNNITGFCLAGKPGIVCIEGSLVECDYWWQRIRAMNWQKILVKLKEDAVLDNDNLDSHRKFSTFQEISFPSSDRHNDMGELYKYLARHGVEYAFKEYFGVEGKPSPT